MTTPPVTSKPAALGLPTPPRNLIWWRRIRHRLQWRLILVILRATVPVPLAGILVITEVAANREREIGYENLDDTANKVVDKLQVWTVTIADELQFLTHHPDLISMEPPRLLTVLQELCQTHPNLISAAHVTASNGQYLSHSMGISGLSYRDRSWFQEALSGKSLSRQVVGKGRVLGKPCVVQASPIRDPQVGLLGQLRW